jgi:hypothetical protein
LWATQNKTPILVIQEVEEREHINFKTEEVGCTGIVLSKELGFNVA